MRVLCVFYILMFCCGRIFADKNAVVIDLIKKWAPLIWLAPNEKFFPSNVDEFLLKMRAFDSKNNVHINLETNSSNQILLPIGLGTEHYYLMPKNNLDFKNNSYLLRGRNPEKYSVPVYVTISHCFSNGGSSKAKESINNLHFQVTYWTFYPYNEGKEFCFFGKIPAPIIFNTCLGERRTMGDHIGDWEHMSLVFKGSFIPEELFLAVHDAGAYYRFDPASGLFKYNRQKGKSGILPKPKYPAKINFVDGHPELFSALGSHGLWSAPGDHFYTRLPKLYDRKGYGIRWKTWNNMEIYNINMPASWMKFRGKWGNPKTDCILTKKLGLCELFDGPHGILMRQKDFSC